jgi:hypothetical protein
MDLDRSVLEEAFREFVARGSGVLVGAPGSGKSFLMAQLARTLRARGEVCVLLPIDRLGIESDADLRAVLGTTDDPFDHLRRLAPGPDGRRGLLLIDALDAARSERGRAFFIEFVRQTLRLSEGSWDVVVSVRTYDAERSTALEEIFPAASSGPAPSAYQSAEIRVRHFFVPELEDHEVRQAIETISGLSTVVAASRPDFLRLLRNPFNLWLLERLVDDEEYANELTEVRSEVELLTLFWRRRVESGTTHLEKQLVLSRVAATMVQERSLSVAVDLVYESSLREAWNELLSAEILVLTRDDRRTGFSHNILFDYAISVLVIEDEPDDLLAFLLEDPSRPLFLRPSLNYLLARLWYEDRGGFWGAFWRLQDPGDHRVRLIARVLPPAIVASEAEEPSDASPVLAALAEGNEVGSIAMLWILQALRATPPRNAAVWVTVLDVASTSLDRQFAWDLAVWLDSALERAGNQPLVTTGIGRAARALLTWVLDQSPRDAGLDRLGALWGVPLVASTFATDSQASRALLMRVLETAGDASFPVDYLYRLTDSVKSIWATDPELVGDVYRAIFDHDEVSEALTEMGGVVLRLTSTRKQDYEMCRYNLVQEAPQFLAAAPMQAVPSLADAITTYVVREHVAPYVTDDAPLESKTVEVSNRASSWSFFRDGSYIWDAPGTHPDDAEQLSTHLFEYLSGTNGSNLRTLLSEAMTRLRVAFLWRRLLAAGADAPSSLGAAISDLLEVNGFILLEETYFEYSRLFASLFSELDADQRLRVESAILGLLDAEDPELDEDVIARRVRQVLLQTRAESLVSEDARGLYARAEVDRESVGAPSPLSSFTFWSSSMEGAEDWLESRGVDVSAPPNRALLNDIGVLEEFDRKWINERPTVESVVAIWPIVERLSELVPNQEDADLAVRENVETQIASCAAIAARAVADLPPTVAQQCKTILIGASEHRLPDTTVEQGDFAMPAWSPAPRNEAAQGLPWIVSQLRDREPLPALNLLAADPVNSVRFLTAQGLFRTAEVAPDWFWDVVTGRLAVEKVGSITDALTSSVLRQLGPETEFRVSATLVAALEAQLTDAEPNERLPNTLRSAIVGLALVRDEPEAVGCLNHLTDAARTNGALLKALTGDALEIVQVTRLHSPDGARSIQRAVAGLGIFAETAIARLKVILAEDHQEVDRDEVRHLFEVIDQIATRIYFALGLFEGSNRPPVSPSDRRALFELVLPLLARVEGDLAQEPVLSLPASTAHRFIELLDGVMPFNPSEALRLAVGVAELGRPSGYAFDSLAASRVVTFVERFLADHRDVVENEPGLSQLVTLLDMFVETGWPQAQRLVWRLEEIFR